MSNKDIVIEMTDRSKSRPGWNVMLSDLANMLKAFLGSNYLTIAYAFTQSGLVMGLVGLLVIASLTDHCCHLIVQCKYHAIRKVVNKHSNRLMEESVHAQHNSLNSYTSDDDENATEDDCGKEMYKQLLRSLTYSDIGRLACGGFGLFVVNLCLAFTQFGFCVGYFIFVGNTLFSMFPYVNTTVDAGSPLISPTTAPEVLSTLSPAADLNSTVSSVMSAAAEVVGDAAVTTTLSPLLLAVNSSSILNHTSSALGGNLSSLLDHLNVSSSGSSDGLDPVTNSSVVTHADVSQIVTTMFPDFSTVNTTFLPLWNISNHIDVSQAPNLKLLVISPIPIFIGFAFLRDVRHLGLVSVGADVAIFVGCVVTMMYLSVGFEVSDTWELYNWTKVPVFFGMVTSSYEGIGTIIPIESSMEGNRHNFGRFLHVAVFTLTSLLCVFGVLGYLRYGDETAQMLNQNISNGSAVGLAINVCLCIGVILTFPLQIYPVIELTELYVFGDGRVCGPRKRKGRGSIDEDDSEDEDDAPGEDREVLLPKSKKIDFSLPVAETVSDEVSTWKRNILRTFVVLLAAAFAVLLRNLFAYVSAFVGALGSSLLAYILPCIFHLKFCWHEINLAVKAKNVIIILFGIFASVYSLYITIDKMVEKL